MKNYIHKLCRYFQLTSWSEIIHDLDQWAKDRYPRIERTVIVDDKKTQR